MEKEIKLPQISEDADSGLVSEIYVKEGDRVEAEQSIIAIENDKATVDVPAEESGKVVSIKISEGDEINVGDVIMVLETDKDEEEGGDGSDDTHKEKKKEKEEEDEDEDEEDEADDAEIKEEKDKGTENKKREDNESESDRAQNEEKADASEVKQKKQEQTSSEKKDQEHSRTDENEEKTEERKSGIPAAPLAKKFARELGIDISDLKGKDLDDRITREDVFGYAKELIEKSKSERSDRVSSHEYGIALQDFSKWGETERKPISGIRKATAKNTVVSWKNIPHVTHFDEADVTELESFRKEQNEQSDTHLTITSFLLKVAAESLEKFPKFNASIDIEKDEIIFKKYIHIGVAVDTDDGLLLPVVRNPDQKTILELGSELTELAEKARSANLSKADMEGGNFVLSNLGGIGGTAFTPIIFPPQVAILGISQAAMVPVYNGRSFEAKMKLPLSLSYDHRLIDGAEAARFLQWICKALEQPMQLLMD